MGVPTGKGHMYTYGWLMLISGRNQQNSVKQNCLSVKKKKKGSPVSRWDDMRNKQLSQDAGLYSHDGFISYLLSFLDSYTWTKCFLFCFVFFYHGHDLMKF